jgi:tetratricopeptide (TPR) repeat protein
MSKTEWFRRTTWSAADREEFNASLMRSRGDGNKAQYLRIQAAHLAEAGQYVGAIELLDRLFAEFPERVEMAPAHAQKAESLAKMGQIQAAVQEYRTALQSERDFPTVRTNAWLDFGWLVLEQQLTQLYDEVARVLEEFCGEGGLRLPMIEYRYATLQSLLADARGEKNRAREFARQALAEAAKDHSGLRYHATVGLVGSERNTFANRLRALADS